MDEVSNDIEAILEKNLAAERKARTYQDCPFIKDNLKIAGYIIPFIISGSLFLQGRSLTAASGFDSWQLADTY